MIPTQVKLVDVGPRDGLQNEKQPVAAAHKIELVHRLQEAGLREIEVTSFVSPKWVPQMADNAEVMEGIRRRPGVRYSVLTPNMRGLEAALATRPDEVVVFGAASEAFSQRNINCSIEESIERFRPVAAAAHEHGIKVRGAISCTVGCPYQGEVSPDEVERVVRLMKNIGVDHVGVADTIGVGTRGACRPRWSARSGITPSPRSAGISMTPTARRSATSTCGDGHPHLRRQRGRPGVPVRQGRDRHSRRKSVFLLDGCIETGIDLQKLVDAASSSPTCSAASRCRVRAMRSWPSVRGGGMTTVEIERPEGFRRVAQTLAELGHSRAPVFLEVAARTAQEAADALDISVGQIAKSIIFRRKSDDRAVLVITSGDKRVDEKKVAALVGPLGRADAEFVKAQTGFSIGGVSPVAHATPCLSLIDRELFRFDEIWAAAGHPNGVFPLSPGELATLTGAPVEDVTAA